MQTLTRLFSGFQSGNKAPRSVMVQPLAGRPRAGYLRIHHLDLLTKGHYGVKRADFLTFFGTIDEAEIEQAIQKEVEFWVAERALPADSPSSYVRERGHYARDIAANWSPERIAARIRAIAAYTGNLALAPGQSVLKVGAARDVYCDNCAIAAHCDALNAADFGGSKDAIAFETTVRDELVELLPHGGYVKKQDYETGTEKIPYRKANGAMDDLASPYMLLTMEAARFLVSPESMRYR